MILLAGAAFILWLYLLSVLSRSKLYFFKYLVGSVGFFFFTMLFIEPYVTKPLGNAVAMIAGHSGSIWGCTKAFPNIRLSLYEECQLYIVNIDTNAPAY